MSVDLLYKQERIGKGGEPFTLYKFRTMRRDAELNGPQWSSGDYDPRVTRFGRFLRKTHIDELPQLWNILRGDMALVGPRPERPEFHEQLRLQIPEWDKRLTVKPGLTSLACVRNGYANSVRSCERKLKYDLLYLKNKSAWLDFKILLSTLRLVVTQ